MKDSVFITKIMNVGSDKSVDIILTEIRDAPFEMKNNKAPRRDGIFIDTIKPLSVVEINY